MSSNWGEVVKKIQNLSGKFDVGDRPDILNKPFFTDFFLENQAFSLGQDWLVKQYLDRLNKPMLAANLWPLFGPEMIKFTPEEGGMAYFDQGVTQVLNVGDHVKMPLMPFTDLTNQGLVSLGTYAPLTMTKSAYLEEGALGICTVEPQAILPTGQVRGRIAMEKATLKWLNKELADRQRVPLPGSLTNFQPGSTKVTKKDILIFDQNSRFYTVLNIAGNPVLLNRVNSSGSEGEISLIRFNDSYTLLVDQLRHLLGGRERAAIRGWSKTRQSYLDELLALSGIVTTGKPQVLRSSAYQSRLTDYAKTNLNLVLYEKIASKVSSPSNIVISEIGFESVQTVLLTDNQLWAQIQNGTIWDAYTIYIIALSWIKLGILKISREGEKMGLVLEKRAWASGLEGYDLPRVPISSGRKITELMPDCGSKRIFNTIETITPDRLPRSRKYVIHRVSDILEKFFTLEYDSLTGAGIIVGLIDKGLIELNK